MAITSGWPGPRVTRIPEGRLFGECDCRGLAPGPGRGSLGTLSPRRFMCAVQSARALQPLDLATCPGPGVQTASPAPTMGVVSAQLILQSGSARTSKQRPGETGTSHVSPPLLRLTSKQSWPGFSSCPSLDFCPHSARWQAETEDLHSLFWEPLPSPVNAVGGWGSGVSLGWG